MNKARERKPKERLKVCFVSCYPPTRGRLAEYAYYLISELQKLPQISRIDVISDTQSDHNVKRIDDKVVLHRVWKTDNVFSLLRVPFKVLRLKPNVVHFNVHMAVFGRTRLANFIGLLLPFLCRLMGFKVVVTLHNIIERIDVEKTGFKNTFLNRLGVFIAYKFLTLSHVITLTMRSYVKLFKERYKCKRVVWIPHGTWKVDRVDPSKVSNSGIILYFGHSGPYKDLSLLLEAFKILKQRMKVKLIIAGESHPNYPGFLEKYKSITSDDVEFTGYVPEEKLPSLFGKATLVVLPYHTCTGTSGVAHLASSYGLPIVATDLPEFRELKEEGCGIILSRHDPETLAEKIELVLNNSELAYRLREKNLEFAKGRSWDKIAQLLLKVYIGAKF